MIAETFDSEATDLDLFVGTGLVPSAGTELCALATHQPTFKQFLNRIEQGGLTQALQERDEKFGDYRTSKDADGD